MTTPTKDYLLRLAIADRDKLARAMVDGSVSPAWGEAAAAVRELLEMRQWAA
jgi:hypothetical protein